MPGRVHYNRRRRWGYRRRYNRRHARRWRRGRRGYRRRARRGPVRRKKTFSIRAHKAENFKRCYIIGWWPSFICDFKKVYKRFKIALNDNGTWFIQPGGWQLECFSFEDLYKEHLGYRNLWTQTNSGSDLVRYKGCTLTFYPHEHYAYVVHWDSDFESVEKFIKFCHPAVLMNLKHHRVILPLDAHGKHYHKIYIKPPSRMENDWRFSEDLSNDCTFLLAISMFDFRSPFFPPNTAWPTDQSSQVKWWWNIAPDATMDNLPYWLSKWNTNLQTEEQFIINGPFVPKYNAGNQYFPAQAYFKYKFRFDFAGEKIPYMKVDNPLKPAQEIERPSIRPAHPGDPRKHWISDGELRSGGELSPTSFERICTTTDSEYFSKLSPKSNEKYSPRRGPSPLQPKKASKNGSRRPRKILSKTRHRQQHRGFDLFLYSVELELGRRLTSQEEAAALAEWQKNTTGSGVVFGKS